MIYAIIRDSNGVLIDNEYYALCCSNAGVTVIPLTPEDTAQLNLDYYQLCEYIAHYNNDILTFSVSLENEKIAKLRNLENQYNLAQVVRFINGITFDFNLRRPAIDEIRMAVSAAAQNGTAFIQVTGIDDKVYKTDCIYIVINKVQEVIDAPMSQYNWSEYDLIRNKIRRSTTIEELNAIRAPNFLTNNIINLNQICEDLFNDELTSTADLAWLSTRRTVVEGQPHYILFEELN